MCYNVFISRIKYDQQTKMRNKSLVSVLHCTKVCHEYVNFDSIRPIRVKKLPGNTFVVVTQLNPWQRKCSAEMR